MFFSKDISEGAFRLCAYTDVFNGEVCLTGSDLHCLYFSAVLDLLPPASFAIDVPSFLETC